MLSAILLNAENVPYVELLENDITFDYTLFTGVDPERFGGVHVILN